MLVVLTETYCNKVNIQITQWDDFIQTMPLSLRYARGKHVLLLAYLITMQLTV